MSNLSQFVGATIPIGGSIQAMPYGGDIYTAPDGTQWYSGTPSSPFPYTTDYSYLPDFMCSSHPIMNGPESDNEWFTPNVNMSIAYDPVNGIYVTSFIYGDATNGYFYYTSTNGSTWTLRQFPFNINYNCIQFTAGKFIAYGPSVTTNGILTSTDGVTWTSITAPASVTPFDIVSNGSTNIVMMGTGTQCAYSTDSGATWASSAGFGSFNSTVNQIIGQGGITYNAGAGLFIAGTGTAGAYQTSPTGATWTNRNAQSTYLPYSIRFPAATKYASNATTTIAVGNGGFFATTTDGLTWSNHGYISDSWTNNVPNQVYYDGTKFVVRWQQRVFYSTNGTTWTEGKPIGGFTLVIPQSNGVLFGFPLLAASGQTKLLRVGDVSSTTRQTVISPVVHAAQATNHTQYRIR